jgi:hypothetical protein
MRGISLGTRAASAAGGGSDVIYTISLDWLNTRFGEYSSAPASIKFKLTVTNGGGAQTTSFIYLDQSQGTGNAVGAIASIATVGAAIEAALNALSGYSGVVVDDYTIVNSVQWDFRVTFPGAMGVTAMAFHASSQWAPTIVLVETVSQNGVADIGATKEKVTLTCTSAESNGTDETVSIGYPGGSCDVTFSGFADIVYSYNAPSGYTLVDGGVGFTYVTFEKDTAGDESDHSFTSQSSNGAYNLTTDVQGAEAIPGAPEIHNITAYPRAPTSGTWKPDGSGSAVSYDVAAGGIETQIGIGGFGSILPAPGVTGTLDINNVTVTAAGNGDLSDTELSPVNVDLSSGEVRHRIFNGVPTHYTITFNDVESANSWNSYAAILYFKLAVTSSGGSGTTNQIQFGDGAQTYAAGDIATDLQGELEAIVGAGNVFVVGSGGGEARYFDVSFDGTISGISFLFDGSSLWQGALTMNTAIAQQGSDLVAGVAEQFTVTAPGGTGSAETMWVGEGGMATHDIIFDPAGNISNTPTVAGYSVTGGGPGNNFVTFTATGTGALTDIAYGSGIGGPSNVTVDVQGVTEVAAVQEVQTVGVTNNAYTGEWSLLGNSVAHSNDVTSVQSLVDSYFGPGVVTVSHSGSGSFADGGYFTFTWATGGAVSDAILAAAVGTLATPVIQRQISSP